MRQLSMWTYPWTMRTEGFGAACETMRAHGVDALTVAAHYHSVRAMQPRFPDDLFVTRSGGCHFEPDPERFGDLAIEPRKADWEGEREPLAAAVEAAHDAGLDARAWLVCFHNSRLGADNPDYRIQSAFGDAHEHSLCPSHPEVREYLATVAEAVVERGVDGVQLEALAYPSVFHPHGDSWGHDKRGALTTAAEEKLLSQCFCDACLREADERGFEIEAARETARSILRDSFETPHATPPPLGALVAEHPELRPLFEFRAAVVADVAERIAAAAGDAAVTYYASSDAGNRLDTAPPGGWAGEGWPTGSILRRLEAHVDRMHASCYVSDPAEARARVRRLRRLVDCPVNAGVTLDPGVVGDRETFRAVTDAVADELDDGDLGVYHYSLLTDAQFDWVAEL